MTLTRTWRLATLLAIVALAAIPAFAQPCNLLDNGDARPQFMIDRDPACGGVAPTIPSQPQLGSGSLTTLFAANNSFAGNTFDLEVIGPDPLTITSFDVNLDNTVGGVKTVTVYYRMGTAVGFENNPAGWVVMGTDAAVVANGTDIPTPVAVGGLTMNPGEVYGIYVDLESYDGGDTINYTNGGPTVYSNAELQLTTNTGQASPAFSGSFFPRQWNGTVYYDINEPPPQINVLEIPTLGIVGLVALILGLGGAAVTVIRRRRHA